MHINLGSERLLHCVQSGKETRAAHLIVDLLKSKLEMGDRQQRQERTNSAHRAEEKI